MSEQTEKATFGAGCFWHVEEAFQKIPGVISARVGYTGGSVPSPSYEKVGGGETGHAEAVTVEYDPEKVSYHDLLEVFWKLHDPTQVNRQGSDIGKQYRSAIFYHNEEQHQAAQKSKQELAASGKYDQPIATQIAPVDEFYEAEEYHQQYLAKQRGEASE